MKYFLKVASGDMVEYFPVFNSRPYTANKPNMFVYSFPFKHVPSGRGYVLFPDDQLHRFLRSAIYSFNLNKISSDWFVYYNGKISYSIVEECEL